MLNAVFLLIFVLNSLRKTDRESSKLNNKTAKNDTMKTYRIIHNVGRAKYLVSYHNGEKFYQDGSAFFDLAIFNNKRKLDKFVKELIKQGYSV